MALHTQGSDDDMAVILRNAQKSYDKGRTQVLDKLNMFVPRGSIYGLLGASGCGKTTLLNVLVGILKLDEGEVKVLGGTPGKKDCAVPGPRIGYMPQDTALVEEFDVKDVIYYFGLLNGMKRHDIESRFEFLTNLLDLPPANRYVKHLSGGQLRRLSFAASMVQSPQVLILDEPTVGQDPIQRHKIWNYMLKLSNEDNVTIIITTHYIAEATEAHRVGLLRNGTLLAETSPKNLLIQLNCVNLEDVSFILSRRQTDQHNKDPGDNNEIELATLSTPRSEELLEEEFIVKPYRDDTSEKLRSSSLLRIRAMIYKNFVKLFRNVPGLFFLFGYPLIQMACFYISMSEDPYLLPIAVVNEELGNCYNLPGGIKNNYGFELLEDDECRFRGLSCLYLEHINNFKVDIVYYDTLEKGLEATKRGRTYSTLHFRKNYTQSMQLSMDEGFGVENTTLSLSEITIWMDMSNYAIANDLKVHYVDKYKTFLEYIADQCNKTNINMIPLRINDPLYGQKDPSYGSFVGPALILSVISFMTTTFSATVILMEKSEGVWDRNSVAGVTSAETVFSHWCTQIFVMLIQIVELIIPSYYYFQNNRIIGSVWIVILLMVLQGIYGNALGTCIGSVTNNVIMAYTASLGSFYPTFLMCGIMWPLEAMPYAMRMISLCMPGTLSNAAMRNVLYRGAELTDASVYPGVLIPIVWVFILQGIASFGINKVR